MKLPAPGHKKGRLASPAKQALVVVAFFVIAGAVAWATTRSQAAGPNLVRWQTNYTKALAQAQATGKPILLDFAADWCGPCQRMQKDVYSQSASATFINAHFIPVRVDMTNPAKPAPLASELGVQGLPTLVIQSPDGKQVARQVGYRGKTMMLTWLASHTQAG